MPYCSQCGNQVQPADVFCGRCGARQPVPAPPPRDEFLSNVSPRAASLVCYIPVIGWIPAIVVLAAARFRDDRTVRFHAFQGLYLFVAWLIVDWVISPFFPFLGVGAFRPDRLVVGLLKAVIFFAWIFMIIKASQDEAYRLPLVGDLAERSVAEQR
jgi:uncharacterized membrane protein